MIAMPYPVLDADGLCAVFSADLIRAMAAGLASPCCACASLSVTWVDLAALGIEPVTDSRGSLNDYAPLHERCVSLVMETWAILLHGDPGEDEAPQALTGDAHPPSEHAQAPSPQGAYARRGAR